MKIVFFIQTRMTVGGNQILFLELGSYIASKYPDYHVFQVMYRHKETEGVYSSSLVTFMDVEKIDNKELENSVIIAPFNHAFFAAAKFRNIKNAKFVFYFSHPEIIKWLENQISGPENNLNSFLSLLKETKSYCFMDSSNYYSVLRRCSIEFEKIFLPIVIEERNINNANLQRKKPDEDSLSIGWLGRLDGDKVNSLINTLDNLVELDLNVNIDFHIIGDGNSKHLINLGKYSKKIRIIFSSLLYGLDRDQYILKNIDLMVAMGMSATDSACLGLATIIPLVSSSPFRDDKYIPVYELEGYSLGWCKEDLCHIKHKCHTLYQLIELYLKDRETFSNNCRNFVIDTFSISNTVNKLLDITGQTTLTTSKLLSNPLISEELKRLDKFTNKNDDYEQYFLYSSKQKKKSKAEKK